MFSSYTSVQGEEIFMRNSATSKVIGEETIQFRSHDGCITTLRGVRHVPKSRYNHISLGALHRKGFVSVRKLILWKFPKRPMDVSSRTCRQCVYVAKFGGYSWWITVILGFKSGGCETIRDYNGSSSDVQLYPKGRLGLGVQQGNSDR